MEFYFYHNTETCVGCCACQLACKDHNNLASGEFYRRVRQASFPGEDALLFDAVNAVGMELCPELDIAIPVGNGARDQTAALII